MKIHKAHYRFQLQLNVSFLSVPAVGRQQDTASVCVYVCLSVSVRVCVRACVCVREAGRDRERGRECKRALETENEGMTNTYF